MGLASTDYKFFIIASTIVLFYSTYFPTCHGFYWSGFDGYPDGYNPDVFSGTCRAGIVWTPEAYPCKNCYCITGTISRCQPKKVCGIDSTSSTTTTTMRTATTATTTEETTVAAAEVTGAPIASKSTSTKLPSTSTISLKY